MTELFGTEFRKPIYTPAERLRRRTRHHDALLHRAACERIAVSSPEDEDIDEKADIDDDEVDLDDEEDLDDRDEEDTDDLDDEDDLDDDDPDEDDDD